MSRNIQTVTKWLPVELLELEPVFRDCKELKRNSLSLFQRICEFLNNLKKTHNTKMHPNFMENELRTQGLDDINSSMEAIVLSFNTTFQKITQEKAPYVLQQKFILWKTALWKIKLKICYCTMELVNQIASLFIYYGENLLKTTLR